VRKENFLVVPPVLLIHATVALLGRTRDRADRRIRSFQATGLPETCWGVQLATATETHRGAREPEQASAGLESGQCEAKPTKPRPKPQVSAAFRCSSIGIDA
jgi:hypothetical protein